MQVFYLHQRMLFFKGLFTAGFKLKKRQDTKDLWSKETSSLVQLCSNTLQKLNLYSMAILLPGSNSDSVRWVGSL